MRCSVADENTFSDNVFLKKQLTKEAKNDFEAGKVYAVELVKGYQPAEAFEEKIQDV